MDTKSFAQIYAAKYLALESATAVAQDLFNIMEVSIKLDSKEKQETTKEFLVKVIELMNEIDSEYTDKVARQYLDKTVEHYLTITPKK